MRVRHSVIVLAVYAISITLWTVVQQNTLRKRDVQIQVLSDDNENLKLSVHKYMTRQQSDHRALKRCETELEPVKRALFQSQAIAYRCEKLMKCELRPEFQPESLKRKFILKKARALQLLHAVQSLDVVRNIVVPNADRCYMSIIYPLHSTPALYEHVGLTSAMLFVCVFLPRWYRRVLKRKLNTPQSCWSGTRSQNESGFCQSSTL